MTDHLQRPLLMVGIVLALAIGCLNLVSHALSDLSGYFLLGGAIAGGIWWLRQSAPVAKPIPVMPGVIDAVVIQRMLAEADRVMHQLAVEVETGASLPAQTVPLPSLRTQRGQILAEMQRKTVRLTVLGASGTGKTTLIQQLQTAWAASVMPLDLTEAPGFFAATETGRMADQQALQQAIAADLALFLVAGDLTASELAMLRQVSDQKRTLLVFSKQDQYLPDDRTLILHRLHQHMQGILAPEDVVAIAAAPNPIKVRQHQPDGTVQEWMAAPSPLLTPLTERLQQILTQEASQLVLHTAFSSAIGLKQQAQAALNQVRRTRALPLVEQMQWMAAATAFASPLPAMDLIVTAAINAQLVLDLGKIYQQPFALPQAQTVATTLGSLILKLGLVELSSQAIANLLKTNAVTYVAGGCLQGVSAAYLTRVTGLSLIEYFSSQDPVLTPSEAPPLAMERLSQILRQVFQQNRQLNLLQTFVGQAVNHLSPGFSLAVPALASSDAPVPNSPLLVENGTGVSVIPQP